jgi:hypothetical protein
MADLPPCRIWTAACSPTASSVRNLGQIQELISPAQNYYNSFFAQVQRRMARGLSLQLSYTFAKSIMLDGMDFNNQFDFSNTHAPSLLDQRHRFTLPRSTGPGWRNSPLRRRPRKLALRLDTEQCHGVLFRPSLRGFAEPPHQSDPASTQFNSTTAPSPQATATTT